MDKSEKELLRARLNRKLDDFQKFKKEISTIACEIEMGEYYADYMDRKGISNQLLERFKKDVDEEGEFIQKIINQAPTFNNVQVKNIESTDFELELIPGEFFPVKFEWIGNECVCIGDYKFTIGKKYNARTTAYYR